MKKIIFILIAFIYCTAIQSQPIATALNKSGGMYLLGGHENTGLIWMGGIIINSNSGIMYNFSIQTERLVSGITDDGFKRLYPNVLFSVGLGSNNIKNFYCIPVLGVGGKRLFETANIDVSSHEIYSGTFSLKDDYWAPYVNVGFATGIKKRLWQLGLSLGADVFRHTIDLHDMDIRSEKFHIVANLGCQFSVKLTDEIEFMTMGCYNPEAISHDSKVAHNFWGMAGFSFTFGKSPKNCIDNSRKTDVLTFE